MQDPPRNFRFVQLDGSTKAGVRLSLGDSMMMELRRVASGDGRNEGDNVVFSERVGLEFNMPSLPAVDRQLKIFIKPDGDMAGSEASLMVDLLDVSIAIVCLRGCDGPAHGGSSFVISISNFPLFAGRAVMDQAFAEFEGGADAREMELEDGSCPAETTCLRLLVPPCAGCRFESGALKVPVKVGFKADTSRSSSILYTYWKAPNIVSAKLGAAGISVVMTFDQATDRGGMQLQDRNCSRILEPHLLGLLAADPSDASCAWSASNTSLTILLGAGATLVPGDILAIQREKLKSHNSLSDWSVAQAKVLAPDYPEPPRLSISGSYEIDPCSSLEIRASVFSPRPAVFSWSCDNDEDLDQALSTLSGPVAYFKEGTAEMPHTDKTYRITVTATTFLGQAVSLHNVLKKASGRLDDCVMSGLVISPRCYSNTT